MRLDMEHFIFASVAKACHNLQKILQIFNQLVYAVSVRDHWLYANKQPNLHNNFICQEQETIQNTPYCNSSITSCALGCLQVMLSSDLLYIYIYIAHTHCTKIVEKSQVMCFKCKWCTVYAIFTPYDVNPHPCD